VIKHFASASAGGLPTGALPWTLLGASILLTHPFFENFCIRPYGLIWRQSSRPSRRGHDPWFSSLEPPLVSEPLTGT